MTMQSVPNIKYAKGVRWLAELYEKKQVSSLTAQTLNKAVEYEVSQSKAQFVFGQYLGKVSAPSLPPRKSTGAKQSLPHFRTLKMGQVRRGPKGRIKMPSPE